MNPSSFDESGYLAQMWRRNQCPNCGRLIPAGQRIGSGKKSEGGFCSLSCYTEYYQTEIAARARKAASNAAGTH